MPAKLWGGRFRKAADPRFERFSASMKWDAKLAPYDLEVDLAHVKALRKARVLTAAEAARLTRALEAMRSEWAAGKLRLRPEAEDVHSAIQEELARRVGAVADKIHTSRSRNDLVAQSARLYCKDHAAHLVERIGSAQRSLLGKADETRDVLLPGMTHLQNAQVLSQAHIFLAYVEMLERAKGRVVFAARLSDVCVVGSGALAGVTFDLDQRLIADELGLSRVTSNSYDVSGDRDFALELLSSLAALGVALSRIAEDLMIAQTRPFSLVDVDQAFCTGSSMMPQKKNADFLELARGAAGVLFAQYAGLATTLKGLPTSYNRDLQWDKSFLFASVETAADLLAIFSDVFRTLRVSASRAKELLADETLYATDLADYLVRKGVAFKTAHEQVGRLVTLSEESGKPLSKIGLDLLRQAAPAIEGDVYALFDAAHSAASKRTSGSTHPARVASEIRAWRRRLGKGR
jgi:argininosuccinate lyase